MCVADQMLGCSVSGVPLKYVKKRFLSIRSADHFACKERKSCTSDSSDKAWWDLLWGTVVCKGFGTPGHVWESHHPQNPYLTSGHIIKSPQGQRMICFSCFCANVLGQKKSILCSSQNPTLWTGKLFFPQCLLVSLPQSNLLLIMFHKCHATTMVSWGTRLNVFMMTLQRSCCFLARG